MADTRRILIKEFLVDGPPEATHLFVFAHGAGLGMAAPFMAHVAGGLAAAGIRVVRFHFPYMEEAVRSGRRRPPDGGRVLRQSFAEVIRHCLEREHCPRERLVIGGKSMGGRMASMIADEHGVAGVVCFGYPFHPPRQPARLRIEHLAALHTPMLICQGERDPFGTRGEVEGYPLSGSIRLEWSAGGDHDLRRRGVTGEVDGDSLDRAVIAATEFVAALPGRAARAGGPGR